MLNPIMASSARRRMRSMRTMLIITCYGTALLLMAVVAMSAFFGSTMTIDQTQNGVRCYILMVLCQFALTVIVAPAMTSGAIAGERERQTLELLLVTNTGSFRIVLGKLMESFLFLALLILSSLPAMCLVMLAGISFTQVITALLFMAVSAFAAATVGLVCSCVMKTTVSATIVSYVCILVIGAGTLIPLILGFSQQVTDVLYDNARYAALSGGKAVGMLNPVLYASPGLGLFSLLEDQTGLFQSRFQYASWGRGYATYLILGKVGYTAAAFLNMGIMTACGLLLTGLSALLVRPRYRRRKGNKS